MRDRPCGNPECGVSTHIGGHLSCGSGELDHNGFWEHPCAPCARALEARQPDHEPVWPYKEE